MATPSAEFVKASSFAILGETADPWSSLRASVAKATDRRMFVSIRTPRREEDAVGVLNVKSVKLESAKLHPDFTRMTKVLDEPMLLPAHFRTKDTPLFIFDLPPQERIDIVKQGLPVDTLKELADALKKSLAYTQEMLGFPHSTMARKVKEGKLLNQDQSERVVQIVRLIGLTEQIVADYGDPERAKDFDASAWLGAWVERPQPSLGMKKPSEYLDTATGIEMIETLLKRIAVGAFA